MKSKKSLLSLGLLALVLVLGVGYAVVSSVTLEISGTASVEESDLKVSFKEVKEVSNSTKVSASVNSTDSKKANITVTGLTLNESVTATYTIQNEESDVAAEVVQGSITNDKPTYFEVTTDLTTAKTVDANGTIDVVVTVKLIKTPIDSADSTAIITIPFTATPKAG